MEIKSMNELNEMHLDVLTEIGNIGSGNAATALATMLNRVVDIDIPKIMMLDYHKVADLLGGSDTMAMSMTVGLEGDIQGVMLHVVSAEFASNLVNTFYPKEIHTVEDITDMDLSVMQEMSNITTAAYVNSISVMAKMFINICPPRVCVDRVGHILESAKAEIGLAARQVLYIDENLVIGGTQIKSSMIMILTLDSLNILFKKLKIDESWIQQ